MFTSAFKDWLHCRINRLMHVCFWIQACASQKMCYLCASTSACYIGIGHSDFCVLITLRGLLIPACCCVRRRQGVSSRPGVEAVCEGSSVVYRPHNGPQQELHTRLQVSTWDCPTGGWAGKINCTHTYSDGSHVVDGPYFTGWCVCTGVWLSLWCKWRAVQTRRHCAHRLQELVRKTDLIIC